MSNEFSRTELMLGTDAMNKLKNVHIAIFGIGGVGGYVVEALSRTGINFIDIIDNDIINITNINRQIFATNKTIGKYKVDVAEERILDINKEAKVCKHKLFFTKDTQFDFSKYDYIVDAIDTVSSKIELIIKAKEFNIPIISSMGTGNKMNPTEFEVADIYDTSVCPLAKIMRSELKKRNIENLKVVYSKEQPLKNNQNIINEESNEKKRISSSNSFVPPVVGFIIASEVIKDLINYN